jgi:ribosomal protein S18 acetylase RimI-like enzyme
MDGHSGQEPVVRPFGEADLEPVVALSLRAWAPVFASLERVLGNSGIFALMHTDWREDQRRAVEQACSSADMQVWVSDAGGQVAGFVAVQLHREDSMGEIYMIAVEPAHQRRGIGTALTGFALSWMKENGMALAMVETGGDPGHAPARRSYERSGFVQLPIARYFKKL